MSRYAIVAGHFVYERFIYNVANNSTTTNAITNDSPTSTWPPLK